MKMHLINFYKDWISEAQTLKDFAKSYGLTVKEVIRLLEIGRKYATVENLSY